MIPGLRRNAVVDTDRSHIPMGVIKLSYTRIEDGDHSYDRLSIAEFNRFDESLLDLGDISKDGKYFEALAAIFDLEAFTTFSNQIDPHLVVPEYMSEFLHWLFQSISKELVKKKNEEESLLYSPFSLFCEVFG